MTDDFKFDRAASGVTAPSMSAATITPNDTTPLTRLPKALYVGVSGDLTVKLGGDATAVTFKNLPVGYHPIRPSTVLATGTTGSAIVALF